MKSSVYTDERFNDLYTSCFLVNGSDKSDKLS